ncbi:hypothetical protein HaLaN_26240 [Haematococcus lacustris]|uniref:Integrase catalytic domain-containing protein n=1 Tax=Haematococcus lacustris TaxID=44745 RepID=A0A6A0A5R4_HAELA|nr:hypothetical protein HaLaN_26240 [Haematococcus lacustris]
MAGRGAGEEGSAVSCGDMTWGKSSRAGSGGGTRAGSNTGAGSGAAGNGGGTVAESSVGAGSGAAGSGEAEGSVGTNSGAADAAAAAEDMELEHSDVKTAFLNGRLKKVIYMHQPAGPQQNGSAERLNRTLFEKELVRAPAGGATGSGGGTGAGSSAGAGRSAAGNGGGTMAESSVGAGSGAAGSGEAEGSVGTNSGIAVAAEQWSLAADEEMQSLLSYGTGEPVDPPQGCLPLANRWVL